MYVYTSVSSIILAKTGGPLSWAACPLVAEVSESSCAPDCDKRNEKHRNGCHVQLYWR